MTADGQDVGTHQGLMYYTLGQRQGLGLGGVRGRAEAPWYVVDKALETNTLIVAQGHNHPRLLSDTLWTEAMHWLVVPPAAPFRCGVKTRYRQADQAATAQIIDGDRLLVRFDEHQRAVTPGQYAVLYDGERCLGGAVIERTEMAHVRRDTGS